MTKVSKTCHILARLPSREENGILATKQWKRCNKHLQDKQERTGTEECSHPLWATHFSSLLFSLCFVLVLSPIAANGLLPKLPFLPFALSLPVSCSGAAPALPDKRMPSQVFQSSLPPGSDCSSGWLIQMMKCYMSWRDQHVMKCWFRVFNKKWAPVH